MLLETPTQSTIAVIHVEPIHRHVLLKALYSTVGVSVTMMMHKLLVPGLIKLTGSYSDLRSHLIKCAIRYGSFLPLV